MNESVTSQMRMELRPILAYVISYRPEPKPELEGTEYNRSIQTVMGMCCVRLDTQKHFDLICEFLSPLEKDAPGRTVRLALTQFDWVPVERYSIVKNFELGPFKDE